MAPIFFGYERTPLALKKVKIALDVFDTYLKRLGKKFSASGEYLSCGSGSRRKTIVPCPALKALIILRYCHLGANIVLFFIVPDNVTIADFPLVTATLCLEAIGFDLSPYSCVS